MDDKKSPAELVADLCLDPGFVLVPQDRYEELIRAETERDVLETTIGRKNSYDVKTMMDAIKAARKKGFAIPEKPEGEGDAE